MYLAVDKLKTAKFERKAMLVISDGGDNRSRYTEGELTRSVRESEVQIFLNGDLRPCMRVHGGGAEWADAAEWFMSESNGWERCSRCMTWRC